MSPNAQLDPERWARLGLGQQILHIATEMQRGLELFGPADKERLRSCYERVFGLVDVTVQVNARPNLRRELLLWRGVVAELFIRDDPDPDAHRLALRVLLELHPESQGQVALLGL